jgi:hypothetical protein
MVLATASHALGARGPRGSSMAETVYHPSAQNAKQGAFGLSASSAPELSLTLCMIPPDRMALLLSHPVRGDWPRRIRRGLLFFNGTPSRRAMHFCISRKQRSST